MSHHVVIGADRGIGEAIARQLHTRGEPVIAACLFDGRALKEAGIRVEPEVDVASDPSIAALAARLVRGGTKITALYHIAGVLRYDELGAIGFDECRRQMEINAFGPLRTVQALLPCLSAGSRVGIVTSRVGSLGDNTSGGMGYAYRMSKAAANMAGLNLHHDLKQRGIAVRMLHPGMVRTNLLDGFPGLEGATFITPAQAAEGLIARIDELTLENSGEFRHANGQLLPW